MTTILIGVKYFIVNVSLICIFLMINDIEHFFMHLLTICVYMFFREMSFEFLCHFKNWLFFVDEVK